MLRAVICFLLLSFLGEAAERGYACTTLVASGKATVDGRPLLWKNRDSWQPQNEVVHFDGETYSFLAVVNAEAALNVWMGVNDAGLCIENSLSRDLAGESDSGPGNGRLMKLALGSCATVEEFEHLLTATNETGRQTRANFGVIDAAGGAAIFETGPRTYKKFDANDPVDAPHGYIVRANFSVTASSDQAISDLYSAGRYQRACTLAQRSDSDQKLDVSFLLREMARDLTDDKGQPLQVTGATGSVVAPVTVDTASTINRRTTVSSVVFHGVGSGEDPALSTMWVLLGQPIFSVAVPCWVTTGAVASQLDGPDISPLCAAAVALRNINYDRTHSRLNTAALPMLCRATYAAEDQIIQQTESRLAEWRQEMPSSAEMARWHQQMSARAFRCLDDLRSDESLRTLVNSHKQPESDSNSVHADFRFDEADGTRLGETTDAAGDAKWDGGLTDSIVTGGRFRIRRNFADAANRYLDINPNVRVGGSSGEQKGTPRGWLVMETSGWNLLGKTANESVRFGFTSRAEQHYQTAGFVIARSASDHVSLSGRAFGDGSTSIESDVTLPVHQSQPVTFVIELDKIERNSGEGEAGGVYRLYYRVSAADSFTQLGTVGRVRRLRNGNEIHLHVEGFFGGKEEYFDIDRLYLTTSNPISR